MIPETSKITPLIDELKHYEDMAQALETKDVAIHINRERGLMEYGLSEQLRNKAQKAIHSLVVSEIKRLQRELKAKLKDIN